MTACLLPTGQRPVIGVLLAAGVSSRFGADKLSAPLPGDGEWVAVRACRNLFSATDRVVAVVRPGQHALYSKLRQAGAELVVCHRTEQGMGVSIATGVTHAGDAGGWLIALADMPWIQPSTMGAVATAIRQGASIAAPTFEGRRGHPVGFAASYRQSLQDLTGDRGARDLLNDAAALQLIPCNDPGVLRDIDTPADLPPPFRGVPTLPHGNG